MPFMELFRGKGRRTWQLRFTDHFGMRRQLSTRTRERGTALAIQHKIERLVDVRIRGDQIPQDLVAWISTRHQDIRRQLVAWQIADGVSATMGVRLANLPPPVPLPPDYVRPPQDLVEQWQDELLAAEVSEEHALQTARRVRVLFTLELPDQPPMEFPGEITADGVMDRIRHLRKVGPVHAHKNHKRRALGPKTCQYYLERAREFCGWLVSKKILMLNPLEGLVAYTGKVMRQHTKRVRRALTAAEQLRLITGTPALAERWGMPAAERALLYRTVLRTGLRAKEAAAAEVRNFNFFTRQVTVLASQGKAKREDLLPIAAELLELLQAHVKGKHPHTPVFTRMDHKDYCAMLQADLEELGIQTVDDLGRVVDFHALRHTYGTELARVAMPAVHQRLMRHKDIRTTMEYYTHLEEADKAASLAKLPSLDLVPANTKGAAG